jgi:sec-independent protein translocase protein TatB
VSAVRGQVSLAFMGTPPTIEFASLGMADSLILMVMALVVFGPRRLPQIGRQIGKLMYEFRKASNDFKFQMEEELRNAEEADRRKKEEERLRTLALAAPPQSAGTDAESQVSEVSAGSPQTGPGLRGGSVGASNEIEAPVEDGQFPAPSPYPGEAVYPAVPPAEFQHEETYPRIQPPSTGEQVPAARPGSLAAQIEVPAAAADETSQAAIVEGHAQADSEPGAAPEQAEQTPTEPVNHHG